MPKSFLKGLFCCGPLLRTSILYHGLLEKSTGRTQRASGLFWTDRKAEPKENRHQNLPLSCYPVPCHAAVFLPQAYLQLQPLAPMCPRKPRARGGRLRAEIAQNRNRETSAPIRIPTRHPESPVSSRRLYPDMYSYVFPPLSDLDPETPRRKYEIPAVGDRVGIGTVQSYSGAGSGKLAEKRAGTSGAILGELGAMAEGREWFRNGRGIGGERGKGRGVVQAGRKPAHQLPLLCPALDQFGEYSSEQRPMPSRIELCARSSSSSAIWDRIHTGNTNRESRKYFLFFRNSFEIQSPNHGVNYLA